MTIPAFWGESCIAALANHLWQSTMVAGIAWLLALALRKNHARVRYWVWMAASMKFLLPFLLLMVAGGWLRSRVPAPAARPALANVVEQVARPFSGDQIVDAAAAQAAAPHASWLPWVLLAIWTCGASIIVVRWIVGWRRIRTAVRAALPLPLAADVPVLCSTALMEPGIFGIFRPVLLLPEEILVRLTPEQLRAIIAHESCHVRRRDNLTFTIHMFVEALFWFYPPVWWVGARLIEERERACDEAVVEAGSAAQAYAEGILNVCKFYVESPVACIAGVTGADLKKRIARIMTEHGAFRITWPKKMLLVAAVLTAVIVPLVLGFGQTATDETNWEKAAGGKQQFEVASVREDRTGGGSSSNFSLDNGNAYVVISKTDTQAPSGTLISARNQTLLRYIIFAYKLSGTQELALRFNYFEGLKLQVPDWVKQRRYDIEARAPGAATKDQMRLMMQSLLADRFKLKVRWETREAPVFALVEEKAGKLGPQLEAHKASDDCTATALPERASTTAVSVPTLSALPIPCGMIAHLPPSTPAARRFGGRDAPFAMLAESMPTQTGLAVLPRPVIDETGLTGGYDFWMEWTPEDTSEEGNSESGGTFREALKNQLGLKLVPKDGSVEVLAIDHVEQPTAN